MPSEFHDRRSPAEYEQVAEIAAQKAVAHVFAMLGTDVSKQDDLNSLRDVLLHARKMQKLSERAGLLAVMTLTAAVVSGALAFMWAGLTGALSK